MKRMSMCMDVEGAIKNYSTRLPNKWSGATDNGRKVSNSEFLEHLFSEHAKGHKVIPMNGKCGSPCQQSDKCTGFDYAGDGCPGYEIDGGLQCVKPKPN
ncbi:MAG TPA: hypothetical protein VFV57_06085 [Limnobacter sp.]|nr:hypothetical protein [Limnobacter sp.]